MPSTIDFISVSKTLIEVDNSVPTPTPKSWTTEEREAIRSQERAEMTAALSGLSENPELQAKIRKLAF